SASASGVTVLPLTLGVILGAVGSGVLSSRIGRFKPILVVGTLWLLAVFVVLHFVLSVDTPLWLAVLFFLLLGLGLGPSQSQLQIAAQNNVPVQRLGSATAAIQFIRQIGSTIGIAVLGTVLANTLNAENCKVFPESASCQPGASVQRSQEGMPGTDLETSFAQLEARLVAALRGDHEAYVALMNDPNLPAGQKQRLVDGGIPAQFDALEAKAVAAAKGDVAAYRQLVSDPNVPEEFKRQLVEGGIPAQVEAQNRQTLAALERALGGDARAKAALLANPQLPGQVRGLLSGPTPPPQAVPGILEGVRRGLEAAKPQVVAQVEAQAIPRIREGLRQAEARALEEVPARLVQDLEATKEKLRTALNNGITQAERNIFLYAAGFVLVSLLFVALLPNEELKGGGGFGARPTVSPG
ncbi:MAG: MFS transporter, partial [Armatimonadota bacterium]